MPILHPASPDTDLQQGDVLKDVYLAIADGAAAEVQGPGYAMVLSRNCNALRDGRIVVAELVARSFNGDVKDLETLDEIRRFFAGIRDGRSSPDQFYLGPIGSDEQQRYVAKLDSLHTIIIPTDDTARRDFVNKHRSHRIDDAFARDLHMRIFGAFAPLGFDDFGWFCDADLACVIAAGNAELQAAKSKLAEAEVEISKLGLGANSKELNGRKAAKGNLEQQVKKAEAALQPYLDEKRKRRT